MQFASDYEFLQQAVFAHINADTGRDRSRFQHLAHPESIDTHVIAGRVQALESLSDRGSNQIFGNPTQLEAPSMTVIPSRKSRAPVVFAIIEKSSQNPLPKRNAMDVRLGCTGLIRT